MFLGVCQIFFINFEIHGFMLYIAKTMRHFCILLILISLGTRVQASFHEDLYAEGAILINAETGAVLFEKNAHAPLFPASVTKIATALYALKKANGQLDIKIKASKDAIASISPEAKRQSQYRCPPYWLETDGTHIGIKNSEEFAFRDLLGAMLIASANDAANVIAENFGKTIPKFVEEMNQYLKKIGCKNCHFLNPHGLHHPEQVASAYDMALIAKEAMKYEIFRELVSKPRIQLPRTNLELERTLVQTNMLLRKGKYYYPQAIGIKTGTTSAAGKALVAAAEEPNGRKLIAVVLGCQKMGQRYEDVIKMFDMAFKEEKMRRTILPKGASQLTKKVIGAKGNLKTHLPNGLYYDYYPSEEVAVKAYTKWDIPQLPIKKDQVVGVVRVVDSSGRVLKQTDLLSQEDLNPSIIYRIKSSFSQAKTSRKVVFSTAILGVVFYWSFVRKKRRRR